MRPTFHVSAGGIALAAGTAKSVLELGTPANIRARILEWWVEFDGVTAANTPVLVEIGRFGAAVTTATTLAGVALDPGDAPALVVAKHSATAEGAGAVVGHAQVHRVPPTSGLWYQAPLGQEFVLAVSTFWRMRLTAAQAVNATVGVVWSE